MAAKFTLLTAATSSARSTPMKFSDTGYGANTGGDVCITIRGTMGSGSATVDVSHDGTNWIPTGTVLSTTTRATLVNLRAGMRVSLDYTAGGGSSWTAEVS